MANLDSDFPIVPSGIPRDGNCVTRFIGRQALKLSGWRFEGELPNDKKLLIAAAPHTSNWDFILVMIAKLALGVHFSFLMKKEAFFWPFKHLFIRLGGIPIDRSKNTGIVDQMVQWLDGRESAWIAVTPEGTRSKVGKWKTGFLRIAEKAQIPVFLVSWDFPTKTIHFVKKWPVTGNPEQDVKDIRDLLLSRYQGRNPKNQ